MKVANRSVWIGLGVVAVIGLTAAALYRLPDRGRTAASLDYRNEETVALGRQIYDVQCASCHGADLEGQPRWRERGADGRLPAPPHDASGHTWHHPDEQLFELTKYGPETLIGGTYESDMPGYEGVLSDEEILAVLAYIKSTWPPEIAERHDEMNRSTEN